MDSGPPVHGAAVAIAFSLRKVSRTIFAEYVQKTEAVAAGRYKLQVDSPFVEFNGMSRSITAMAKAVSHREGELRRTVSEREQLLREIHHRGAGARDPVYGQSWLDEVDPGDYTGHLLDYLSSSYGRHGTSIERRIATTRLSLDQALPCSLILNELITNAFKYGVGDRSGAKLIVSLMEEPAFLVLSVEDDGPGFQQDFDPLTSSSLGVSLVRSLTEQLGGTASWSNRNHCGTLASVRFPKVYQENVGPGTGE